MTSCAAAARDEPHREAPSHMIVTKPQSNLTPAALLASDLITSSTTTSNRMLHALTRSKHKVRSCCKADRSPQPTQPTAHATCCLEPITMPPRHHPSSTPSPPSPLTLCPHMCTRRSCWSRATSQSSGCRTAAPGSPRWWWRQRQQQQEVRQVPQQGSMRRSRRALR